MQNADYMHFLLHNQNLCSKELFYDIWLIEEILKKTCMSNEFECRNECRDSKYMTQGVMDIDKHKDGQTYK